MSSLVLWLISLIRDFCQLGWRTCCGGDTPVLEEEPLEQRVQQGPQQSQHLPQLQSFQPVQPVIQNMATNTIREPPSYADIISHNLNFDEKEKVNEGLRPTGTPTHREPGHREPSASAANQTSVFFSYLNNIEDSVDKAFVVTHADHSGLRHDRFNPSASDKSFLQGGDRLNHPSDT